MNFHTIDTKTWSCKGTFLANTVTGKSIVWQKWLSITGTIFLQADKYFLTWWTKFWSLCRPGKTFTDIHVISHYCLILYFCNLTVCYMYTIYCITCDNFMMASASLATQSGNNKIQYYFTSWCFNILERVQTFTDV